MDSVKKEIPQKIIDLFINAGRSDHRSLLFVVGQHGTDRIHIIYDLLSKKSHFKNPNVNCLWCYNKELKLSTNKQKRTRQLDKLKSSGVYNDEVVADMDRFLGKHELHFYKYSDSHKVLGRTFEMLVLQDFRSITPNILARTVETVAGGGLIVILLNTMSDIKELHGATMDYHRGMNRDTFGKVSSRFNARFLGSIKNCKNCLAITDEFSVLEKVTSELITEPEVQIDAQLGEVKSAFAKEVDELKSRAESSEDSRESKRLLEESKERAQVSEIIDKSVTSDQARTVIHVFNQIKDRALGRIVGITAARGRGKSAAIGLSLASALVLGYSNIFVTAPAIANLQTLFEFIVEGLKAVGLREGEADDYELVRTRSKDGQEYVVRINVHVGGGRRQTVQFVHPNQTEYLSQCEILAIDEAAAIPLPLVKELVGPYTTLFSSTVDGYEGTGRALSIKLFQDFERTKRGRFSRITLNAPIRYAAGDPIEAWLHSLLLLDVRPQKIEKATFHERCQLFYINRDVLFRGTRASEVLLRSLVALSVASHYKNTPNDLTLLADAPNHRIFALLDPTCKDEETGLPQIFCFVQVALEGRIERAKYADSENRGGGHRAGDLIPWNIAHAFDDPDFAELTGARIVRIAVHPDNMNAGYGSAAVKQLLAYYSGQIPRAEGASSNALFLPLDQAPEENVDYVGVSFGLTKQLLNFWKRSGFVPLYISRETNEITGEHSTIVVQPTHEAPWLDGFRMLFRTSFLRLLPTAFKTVSPFVLESILFPTPPPETEAPDASGILSERDVKAIAHWAGTQAGEILELLPPLAEFVFEKRPPIQCMTTALVVLLMMGRQMIDLEETAKRLNVQHNTVLSCLHTVTLAVAKYLGKLRGEQKDPRRKIAE